MKKGRYGDHMRVRTESKEYVKHEKLNYWREAILEFDL